MKRTSSFRKEQYENTLSSAPSSPSSSTIRNSNAISPPARYPSSSFRRPSDSPLSSSSRFNSNQEELLYLDARSNGFAGRICGTAMNLGLGQYPWLHDSGGSRGEDSGRKPVKIRISSPKCSPHALMRNLQPVAPFDNRKDDSIQQRTANVVSVLRAISSRKRLNQSLLEDESILYQEDPASQSPNSSALMRKSRPVDHHHNLYMSQLETEETLDLNDTMETHGVLGNERKRDRTDSDVHSPSVIGSTAAPVTKKFKNSSLDVSSFSNSSYMNSTKRTNNEIISSLSSSIALLDASYFKKMKMKDTTRVPPRLMKRSIKIQTHQTEPKVSSEANSTSFSETKKEDKCVATEIRLCDFVDSNSSKTNSIEPLEVTPRMSNALLKSAMSKFNIDFTQKPKEVAKPVEMAPLVNEQKPPESVAPVISLGTAGAVNLPATATSSPSLIGGDFKLGGSVVGSSMEKLSPEGFKLNGQGSSTFGRVADTKSAGDGLATTLKLPVSSELSLLAAQTVGKQKMGSQPMPKQLSSLFGKDKQGSLTLPPSGGFSFTPPKPAEITTAQPAVTTESFQFGMPNTTTTATTAPDTTTVTGGFNFTSSKSTLQEPTSVSTVPGKTDAPFMFGTVNAAPKDSALPDLKATEPVKPTFGGFGGVTATTTASGGFNFGGSTTTVTATSSTASQPVNSAAFKFGVASSTSAPSEPTKPEPPKFGGFSAKTESEPNKGVFTFGITGAKSEPSKFGGFAVTTASNATFAAAPSIFSSSGGIQFGADGKPPMTTSSSTFGSFSTPATASAPSAFGSFSASPATTTPATGFGSFSSTTTTAAPATGFGSFSTPTTTAAPTTGFGSFSTPTTTAAPATGFGSFSTPTTTAAPATGFGSFSTPTTTAAPATGFGSFSTPTSTVSTVPSCGPFLTPTTTAPSFGAFSTPTTTAATAPSFASFSSSATATPAFGFSATPAAATTTVSSTFSTTTTPATFQFGAKSEPFKFGATAPQPTQPQSGFAAPANPTFGATGFGSTPAAPSIFASSTPAFGAPAPAAPAAAAGPFQASQPAPAFQFGATQPPAPQPATGGFNFGAPSANPTPPSGGLFQFGAVGNPQQQQAQMQPQGSPAFTFNAPAAPPGFNFGGSGFAPGVGGGAMFSIGSGSTKSRQTVRARKKL